MHKHREKSPAGIIAISAIATSLVLGGLSFLFIIYGLPVLPFSVELLYTVLLRLLPIIIGLILVLIALAIRPPAIPRNTDIADEIQKDMYTMPLYNLPEEDENEIVGKQQLPVSAKLKEPPAESDRLTANRLEDLQPVVTPFEGAPPAAYIEEKIEVPEPVVMPKQEIIPTEDLQRHTLGRPVLFSEYPYPIQKDSQIAELLAPIDETIEDGALAMEDLETIEDTFETRLESELDAADSMGYDLSLAIIDLPETTTDPHSVDATIVQNLFNRLGIVSFFYLIEEHRVSAIMPFHDFEQCRRYFASLLESFRKQHPETAIKIGYSSSKSRRIGPEELIQEASVAADIASERFGYSLIGYDIDLEADPDSTEA
jgi:hypothetical protein